MTRSTKTPGLSEADEALWARVAATVERTGQKGRVTGNAGDPPALTRATVVLGSHGASAERGERGSPRTAPAPPESPPRPADRSPPHVSQFDRRTAKRLKGGRLQISARIDLHGMRQTEAHSALRRFLFAASARGDRLVLVITGKGAPGASHDGHGRGVLRSNVPRWLCEPEMRSLVVSYTTASARHGGEGALYVQLRSSARLVSSHGD